MASSHDASHTESPLRAASLGDRSAPSALIDTHRDYLRRVIDLRMDPALRGRVDPSDIGQETQMVASKTERHCPKATRSGFETFIGSHDRFRIGESPGRE